MTTSHLHLWEGSVSAEFSQPVAAGPAAEQTARLFGLDAGRRTTLYDDLPLCLTAGSITVVLGPSGAGKSVLLRRVARHCEKAVVLAADAFAQEDRSPVDLLAEGSVRERLEILGRCGLADATCLTAPARLLSGGQHYRLALAALLHRAGRAQTPVPAVADEFCSSLDDLTAALLCRRVRRMISGSDIGLLVAMPRETLLPALQPDRVIVKPLGEPPVVLHDWRLVLPHARRTPLPEPCRWPIQPGRIADYHALGRYHYVAGPPAAHKRVHVVRVPSQYRRPGQGGVAAVLVVSPPLMSCRGRNIATARRYVDRDRRAGLRRLNDEVETISRVVVHPTFRGMGLAGRLIRHVLRHSPMRFVEALAAMGKIHPLFDRAGMTCAGLFKGRSQYYRYYIHETGGRPLRP